MIPFGDPLFDIAVLFILGAILGSFGNVCIYRIPAGESVVTPGSHCQKCQYAIPWYLNIPILGWFFVRGRCKNCGEPVSFRYPLVEFLVGLSFTLLYLRYGWSWTLLEYSVFVWGIIISSFIDIDHMILPDVFTLSGIVLGLVGSVLNPERQYLNALVGVVFGGGFLYMVAYFYYVFRKIEGMGGGDIKLLAWVGAYLGWKAIPFTLVCSSFLGLFIGVAYLKVTKQDMKTGIPFGPFLAFGALIYTFFDISPFWTYFFPFASTGM
jgi:leader peptidase (prepilin peptidase) / N-methyltransferase